MATGIGINGFGRIDRLTFHNIMERHGQELEIVGLNDLTNPETNAHLLQGDSTYRKYPGNVEAAKDSIRIDVKAVRVSAERDPAKLPWRQW
jgi:glyceraldehyde 3-phosphate dehydrogenase